MPSVQTGRSRARRQPIIAGLATHNACVRTSVVTVWGLALVGVPSLACAYCVLFSLSACDANATN
eukprot:gene12940-8796_t